jgi:hypothetical protein
MPRAIIVVAAVILIIHGLIHLMGLTVYLRLGDLEGFAYKTTVLGGRVDLGTNGTRVFGALWVVPAIAFVAGAVALYASWNWWQPVLMMAASISLVLTLLDWNVAFVGAMVDVAILACLWLGPLGKISFLAN